MEAAQKYPGQTDNTTIPSAKLIQELGRVKGDVETVALEYRTDRKLLETLVSDTAGLTPADGTLEQVLEQRAAAAARQFCEQLAKAVKEAKAEAQRVLRETDEKAIKETTQAEAERRARLAALGVQRIRDETEQDVIAAQKAAAEEKRVAEAQRLDSLAKDPRIQRKYSAFLEKGLLQFASVMMRKSDRPAPVSLGDLDKHDWLKSVERFAMAMSRSPAPNWSAINDRPTHPYPKTAAEWAEMERLLEQFKLLAPIWVNMKLLNP
ncbi:MAG: hypothetical protein NTY19_43945 [Planctomycetota bacterium]|nr:hypothetical protein [Planctomycetota bacterium]